MLPFLTKSRTRPGLGPLSPSTDLPKISGHDLFIKVQATGINAIETNVLNGDLQSAHRQIFPEDRGADISGEIVACGAGVSDFSVGDQVFGRLIEDEQTRIAEYVRVPQHQVSLKPSCLTHEQAAGLPWAGLSAYQALFEGAKLRENEDVLIHGGDELPGAMAIQLAKAKGAHVATTIQGANRAWVERLGPDQVIESNNQYFHELIWNVDVVFNPYGDAVSLESLPLIRPGGRLVALHGAVDAETARRQGLNLIWRWIAGRRADKVVQTATTCQVAYRRVVMRPDHRQLALLADMVEQGRLKPLIGKVYPYAQAKEALHHTQTKTSRGKVVVSMTSRDTAEVLTPI
ncbi:NADP-dependent oxidoreductase [Acanthopleuribacter pedis]|uniref:NADP-dependent oxidoreductase n=1 Tax=Acanthopleuribacter pedis TaxID=442870 RepID=A0A8J7QPP2_9BACT|nr:NADP-dependent oxidoreductase [Acanthopleuribacter pedis]MBO1322373.1 NADP-dependent oxidoreductase [Acanthopleuribacter pedis]